MSLDLPTSHNLVNSGDEFTDCLLKPLNSIILDLLEAISRKDYEDRRRRQKQGVKKAKEEGKYKGRPKNQNKRDMIAMLLKDGRSYTEIQNKLNCARGTIASVKREVNATK